VLIQLLEAPFDHSEPYFAVFRFESPENHARSPADRRCPATAVRRCSRIRPLGGLPRGAELAPDDGAAPGGPATEQPNWNHPHFWAVFAIRDTRQRRSWTIMEQPFG
jgi:hypothetical protein